MIKLKFMLRIAVAVSCFLSVAPLASAHDSGTGTKTFEGTASWYGSRFHGRPTASGETFNMNALTAAHPSLPFGTRLRVTHEVTGKSVVVRINDRGPHAGNRMIDLSKEAADGIGLLAKGVGRVKIEVLPSA